ncbi:arsenic resistance protein [Anaerobacillus sp. CMMVII]|uniref:arsenic resistance protein n=1 Tax=Anaerobacillus sp. CMMVII TaxID=2755588 RepID=UPI0021B70E49|nr:bile acid:sodium symporter [Anaerobacillus sp. CMMVII]MCT8136768.1 arsenic resistance protein [Anaerobacillus sp. CMMVII]
MNVLEKLYTGIIFLAVVLGIVLGQSQTIQSNAESFIFPLLVAMLYISFLQVPIEDVKKAFKNIRFTSISVFINFIWTPIFAWLLALLFLGDNPVLYLGFIMLMVTPCTDWYIIFTGMAKGNVGLSTAILPINLLLQVVLLPIYLLIFGGTTGVIEFKPLLESILFVLCIPLFLALITKVTLKNRQQLRNNIITKISVLPILFLSLAIVAMFASQGQLLLENLDLMWKLTIPILIFFSVNFIFTQKVAQKLNFPYQDGASLSLTTLARNSPIALAIALTAFPDLPLLALTLVIGPLLELPLLAIITQFLLFKRKGYLAS